MRRFVRRQASKISHTDQALIHGVELRHGEAVYGGEMPLPIPHLGDLSVDVDYELVPEMTTADLIVRIYNQAQDYLGEVRASRDVFRPHNSGERSRARVYLDRLELNPGVYVISVSLEDQRDNFAVAQAQDVGAFQITGPAQSKAIFQPLATWQHLSD